MLFFAFGCSKPVGTSTLLTSDSLKDPASTTPDAAADEGQIGISAENPELSVSVDDSDKVEITGKCTDLDRRKNRILVEVFAGEDETATPYISNAISDFCQNNLAGLPTTDICFWVTKGIGIIEPAPVNRSFPQCHDGVFGFSIKLGKILLNAPNPSLKYTVRFKLRTLEGILADSPWSRVAITRNLNTPSIDKVSANDLLYSCLIETSPARFNQEITYTLDKTGIGIGATPAAFPNIYGVPLTTAIFAPNASVFSWLDLGPTKGIIAGATYTYTLTSTHSKAYVIPYAPNPTATSNQLTCSVAAPQIYMSASPTPAVGPTASGICYMAPASNRVNPNLVVGGNYQYEWRVETNPGWTGVNSDFEDGSTNRPATCASNYQAGCTASGLVGGIQYYFAVREKYTGVVPNIVGKWSNVVPCTPPQN